MKELFGTSANFVLVKNDSDKLIGQVEVVLIVSEVKYQADPTGMSRTRSVEDLRFATGIKGLKMLATEFAELANQAQELEDRASFRKSEEA